MMPRKWSTKSFCTICSPNMVPLSTLPFVVTSVSNADNMATPSLTSTTVKPLSVPLSSMLTRILMVFACSLRWVTDRWIIRLALVLSRKLLILMLIAVNLPTMLGRSRVMDVVLSVWNKSIAIPARPMDLLCNFRLLLSSRRSQSPQRCLLLRLQPIVICQCHKCRCFPRDLSHQCHIFRCNICSHRSPTTSPCTCLKWGTSSHRTPTTTTPQTKMRTMPMRADLP